MVGTHCVRDETLVGRINHFLYKYIIPKSNFVNSSHHLFDINLDSIEQPGCRTADGGWREEDRRHRDGGSEVGKEGGSDTERTKERRREAGHKKEERVRRSNEAEE